MTAPDAVSKAPYQKDRGLLLYAKINYKCYI